MQNTLDIEKGKILQTLQKQIANVWSRSNKCDNTILLTLSSTQYTMGHYTVKKSLKKSDNEKVGQRFISWELLDPTPFEDAFKIIYTHLAWPFVAAALHNHSKSISKFKRRFS